MQGRRWRRSAPQATALTPSAPGPVEYMLKSQFADPDSKDLPLPSSLRLAPFDRPRAGHLAEAAPLPRRVVGLEDARLALVGLAEGVAALLAHALHLAHLADGLLELLHARAVVLDVVLLDLLDVVVGLRAVHALGVLPRHVARQADDGYHGRGQVDGDRAEDVRHDAVVLLGEVQERRDGAVEGHEDQPHDEAAGDGDEGPLGPHVGDERGLAQHRQQDRGVQPRAPDPVAVGPAVRLGLIRVPDAFGQDVGEQRMEEAVDDPADKGVVSEKDVLLPKSIELRISVEESRRDELIEDAHGEGRRHGEEDIVEGERPRLVNDLSGEGILERVLNDVSREIWT